MSVWTHVAGCIRIDDMKKMGLLNNQKDEIDLNKIFIRNTWNNPNDNGNMPTGSEGSIDVEITDRNEEGTEYMRVVTLFGDLRDYGKKQCEELKKWWYDIPQKLGRDGYIRNAVLQVTPGDGESFVLTEKDMNIIEDD